MPYLNRIQVAGHLGKDADFKVSGKTDYCRFSVATSYSYKRNDEWVEETVWFIVTCFGKTAEAMKNARKGDGVYVEGRLQVKEYEDKSGVKRQSIEIVADFCVKLQVEKTAAKPAPVQDAPIPASQDEEDIPF
jgi:single-strand DNA-binding protein